MVQVTLPESQRSRSQRNSAIAESIRVGGTKPTTLMIVQNTMPTELLRRVLDPSTLGAKALKVERVSPTKNGDRTNSKSHISLQHLIK
jgi:hypothetical protein